VSLLWLEPDAVRDFCESLTITQKDTGATAPWRLNDEQLTALDDLTTGRWVFFAKPRQIGMTSLVEADDLLWCWLNDRAGNRVRAALYVDTEKKLKEREAFAKALDGQTRPLVDGVEWKDQDYFYWEDYDRWKKYGNKPPVGVWD
jgi:hypothetical protein